MTSPFFCIELQPIAHNEEPSDNLLIECSPGQTLAQAVYLSGVAKAPALCSGIGRCGRCRMKITPLLEALPEDIRFFQPGKLAEGWRLGCRHHPTPGMRVELPHGTRARQVRSIAERSARVAGTADAPAHSADSDTARDRTNLHDSISLTEDVAASNAVFLAVDLGTTSMQWRMEDTGGKSLQHGAMLNPQMGAGSDVISRLAVAQMPGGAARLQGLVLDALMECLEGAGENQEKGQAAEGVEAPETERRVDTPKRRPVALCVAANPAMTCIAMGHSTQTLAVAPYALPYRGGLWEHLPGLPPVWTPPQLTPFVGGDISAGYAALAARSLAPEDAVSASRPEVAFPFLLADMGTNGEFLLALSPSEAVVASVALGPALEGISLRFGTEARPGAVTGFSFSPHGLEMKLYETAASAAPLPFARPTGTSFAFASPTPVGISGTGYISLLHQLLKMNAITREGRFTPEKTQLTARLFARSKALSSGHSFLPDEPYLPLPGEFFLTATDVEEILKVKAAFSMGLQRLLPAVGIASHDLRAVYLAGALGAHVDIEALENLGFFPQGLCSRIQAVGNSSLDGAALLLRSDALRNALTHWATGVRGLDLASDSEFQQGFVRQMRFSW